MTIREDAILLAGFIYGTSSSIPTAIRRAIDRITQPQDGDPEPAPKDEPTTEATPVQSLNTSSERVQKRPENEQVSLPEREERFASAAEASDDRMTAAAPESPAPEKTPEAFNTGEAVALPSASPEARAAAAQRLRDRQAAGLMKRKGATEPEEAEATEVQVATPAPSKPYTPVSVKKLQTQHDEYIGQRDYAQALQDDDWFTIERMLNKERKSVMFIAGQYKVEFAEMRAFIDKHQAKAKRPGEV